jgi:hypothetical protein
MSKQSIKLVKDTNDDDILPTKTVVKSVKLDKINLINDKYIS